MAKSSAPQFPTYLDIVLFLNEDNTLEERIPLVVSSEEELSSIVSRLTLLQDIYYVSSLANIVEVRDDSIYQDKLNSLNSRDIRWSRYNFFIVLLIDFIKTHKEYLADFRSYDNVEEIQNLKGKALHTRVEMLGEPYVTRFHVLNILYKLNHPKDIANLSEPINICVFSYISFVEAVKSMLNFVTDKLLDLQKDRNNWQAYSSRVMKYYNKNKYKTSIIANYFGEGRKCAMIAEITTLANRVNEYLVFSGVYYEPAVMNQINDLKKLRLFKHHTFITATDKIEFFFDDNRKMSLKEVKDFKQAHPGNIIQNENVLFSCCERKMIAEGHWNNCRKYRMIIKFAPCVKCSPILFQHLTQYNGSIYFGTFDISKGCGKTNFWICAENIYKHLHP